jgi:arabinofuranan 3-O-arabinosyltransferase
MRSGTFWGWCGFVLCVELMGYGLAHGVARSFDFAAFYAAGRILRSAPSHLYDVAMQMQVERAWVGTQRFFPFYHLSYEALLYAPLSLLSYAWAYVAWMGVNLGALAVAYGLGPKAAGLGGVPRMVLFFGLVPTLFCLMVGQNSLLFLMVLCVVWRCVERGRWGLAGVVLGLGLFKLPLAIVIAALLALRLGWRFAAGFAASAAGVLGVCVGLVGIDGTRAMVGLMREAAAAPAGGMAAQARMAVIPQGMPNLNGLVYVAGGGFLTARAAMTVELTLAAAVLVGCAVLVRRVRRPADAFCVAVTCGLLVSQHAGVHDMSLLLVPVLLGAGRMQRAWVVLCYALPVVLFGVAFPRFLALDGVVPLLFLAGVVYELWVRRGGERQEGDSEKVLGERLDGVVG